MLITKLLAVLAEVIPEIQRTFPMAFNQATVGNRSMHQNQNCFGCSKQHREFLVSAEHDMKLAETLQNIGQQT